MDANEADIEDIFKQRVGVRLNKFFKELDPKLCLGTTENNDNDLLVIALVAAPRALVYDDNLDDLALNINCNVNIDGSCQNPTNSSPLAVEISNPPVDECVFKIAKRYQRMVEHALYLDTPAIYIRAPVTIQGIAWIAGTINNCVKDHDTSPCVLVTIPTFSVVSNGCVKEKDCATSYNNWISLISFVRPSLKIGVCLELNDDIIDASPELRRWTGEKVRTIIIHTDRFIVAKSGGSQDVRLSGRCKEFIKEIVIANSFKVALVVDGIPGENLTPYTSYLKDLFNSFLLQNPDELRFFNDKLFIPLQPLASNLSSSIYSVFEIDKVKYTSYETSMFKALRDYLLKSVDITPGYKGDLVLMVLGAGRGPLVDAFLNALRDIEKSYGDLVHKAKIYALDKNPSSIVALRFKQSTEWSPSKLRLSGLEADVSIEVVESDMRIWKPNCKADIIATELLGSLADNELSPECIDGAWTFSRFNTISIPQEYSSYLAPISCQKIWQEVFVRSLVEDKSAFDRLHVCRFANIYTIDSEQKLFSFHHKDISRPPVEYQNERYVKLQFTAQVRTVCHGFAGYFKAKLYDDVVISTLPNDKTPTMESWFAMYIPLQRPVPLNAGDELVFHFWRKQSNSKVWYEWVVTSPTPTRMHSMYNTTSAMSKLI